MDYKQTSLKAFRFFCASFQLFINDLANTEKFDFEKLSKIAFFLNVLELNARTQKSEHVNLHKTPKVSAPTQEFILKTFHFSGLLFLLQ